ncbi:MAG TPA: hypothetical protein VLT33_34200 [Labilithrix sp.]|nr:hypothetical protein [Labilithrix sp.]
MTSASAKSPTFEAQPGPYQRLPVEADPNMLRGIPAGFTWCDGSSAREQGQANAGAARALTSNGSSLAGLHGKAVAGRPRLSAPAPGRKLAFSVERSELSFDLGKRADELLTGLAAVDSIAETSDQRARFYRDIEVLAVMFPSSSLALRVRSVAEGSARFDLQVYLVVEPAEQVLRAFDEHGARATRASCEHGARGWAIEAQERPGWSYRRASVALQPSCEDGTTDLQLYVRRVLDTTVVLACRDDSLGGVVPLEDTCSEVSRTLNVRSHP